MHTFLCRLCKKTFTVWPVTVTMGTGRLRACYSFKIHPMEFDNPKEGGNPFLGVVGLISHYMVKSHNNTITHSRNHSEKIYISPTSTNINPLSTKLYLSDLKTQIYRAVNTLCFGFKKPIQRNNRCLLWDPRQTHKCTGGPTQNFWMLIPVVHKASLGFQKVRWLKKEADKFRRNCSVNSRYNNIPRNALYFNIKVLQLTHQNSDM